MYIDSLKFLSLFSNSSSFIEDTTQTNISVFGEDTLIEKLDSGNGYHMKENQYLFWGGESGTGHPTSISSEFCFGFWMFPYHRGIVSNPSSDEPESITMPLIDFEYGGESIIGIKEHSDLDGGTYLSLHLENNSYIATTGSFLSSFWHYIWISYDGLSVSFYVDGVLMDIEETGSVPSSISGSVLSLYVNHSLDGYGYAIAKNNGYLDDIFLLNVPNVLSSDLQKAINRGILYVVDDSYYGIEIQGNSIYMSDPYTITVTTSIDDMAYVFIGRNDGKILRGSPLLWEVRKFYADTKEASLLSLKEGNSINSDSGFLEITNQMIRL